MTYVRAYQAGIQAIDNLLAATTADMTQHRLALVLLGFAFALCPFALWLLAFASAFCLVPAACCLPPLPLACKVDP